MERFILILGATSAIAHKTADAFAKQGYSLYLAGRDANELPRLASDLQIRHNITVHYGLFDAENFATHPDFFNNVVNKCQMIAGVLWAVGDLGNSELSQLNHEQAIKVININLTGAVSILNCCADYFIKHGNGFIIGITSVAGDRGRQSNYIYGAAKGGLSLYLQGLRNHLFHYGIKVITIKPGFIDTRMTFGMQKLFLVASPDYIGTRIANSINKSQDILYIPWFWRYIMLIIKSIPEFIFKKLKL